MQAVEMRYLDGKLQYRALIIQEREVHLGHERFRDELYVDPENQYTEWEDVLHEGTIELNTVKYPATISCPDELFIPEGRLAQTIRDYCTAKKQLLAEQVDREITGQ